MIGRRDGRGDGDPAGPGGGVLFCTAVVGDADGAGSGVRCGELRGLGVGLGVGTLTERRVGLGPGDGYDG
jgi:hypothetical protein